MPENTNVQTANTQVYENDYAVSRVPKDKRKSFLGVTMVMIGFCISMAGLYTGAALTDGLDLSQAIWAAILGNVILTVYAGLVGIVGAREGMGTALLMRRAFGRFGADIISIVFAATMIGWYAYQCGFFGATINAMFPGGGFITQPVVAGIWGGALMMLTAYRGFKGLEMISSVAAPVILIMSIIGIGVATHNVGGFESLSTLSMGPGAITFSTGVVMVVGAFAVGGVIQPDITRYSKNASHGFIATAIGFIIAHSVVIIAGYIMCKATGSSDIALGMLATLGVPSLIVLILAQWTTNDNNLYSSSLALNNIIPKFKKKHLVLILGTIATLLGAFGLGNYLVVWLTILGTCIPPLAGVVIADYYFLKKRKYDFGKAENSVIGGLSIPAMVAWIVATIVGFTVSWGIGCINALVVSFVVYLIIASLCAKSANRGFAGGHYEEGDDGSLTQVNS